MINILIINHNHMSVFGRVYRITTFGESHSKGVGCVIEGFPSNY